MGYCMIVLYLNLLVKVCNCCTELVLLDQISADLTILKIYTIDMFADVTGEISTCELILEGEAWPTNVEIIPSDYTKEYLEAMEFKRKGWSVDGDDYEPKEIAWEVSENKVFMKYLSPENRIPWRKLMIFRLSDGKLKAYENYQIGDNGIISVQLTDIDAPLLNNKYTSKGSIWVDHVAWLQIHQLACDPKNKTIGFTYTTSDSSASSGSDTE